MFASFIALIPAIRSLPDRPPTPLMRLASSPKTWRE
jgi:hypothetical protein